MIEIIPNWHPLFVHFTVGLLSVAVLFYFAATVLSKTHPWKLQWYAMANWSLWTGCVFVIATATAGWLAYNSVAHDSLSHAAMTLHRNWALPTASIFLLLGIWAVLLARTLRRPGFLFLTCALTAFSLLMITGWLGAEAVYRYGLGVRSLPVVEEGVDGHNHSHGQHDHAAGLESRQDALPEGTTGKPVHRPASGQQRVSTDSNTDVSVETSGGHLTEANKTTASHHAHKHHDHASAHHHH